VGKALILAIVSLFLLSAFLVSINASAEGVEEGMFPNRTFYVTRSPPGGPRSDIYYSNNTTPAESGLWSARLDQLAGSAIIVQVNQIDGGSPVLIGAWKLRAVGQATPPVPLYQGSVYQMSFTPYGKSGTSILRDVWKANLPPDACFTYSPASPYEGQPISFDASCSADPDGTIASYSWDFGDGNTASGAMTTHTYGMDGTYDVTLRVADNLGGFDVLTVPITVLMPVNEPPVAAFSWSPLEPKEQDPVMFDGRASRDPDGMIVSYSWDFGDGNTATGSTATNTYAMAGLYTVTLTVTDDDGATDDATAEIRVLPNDPPVAQFSWSPLTPKALYDDVRFDGSVSYDSDGFLVAWDWDFGDGHTGTGSVAINRYSLSGDYPVTLRVTDNKGATGRSTETIRIVDNLPPTASFTWTPSMPKEGRRVDFDASASNDPDGTIVDYHWVWGDSLSESSGTSPLAFHTYAADGTYTVYLRVVDRTGNAAFASRGPLVVDTTPPALSLPTLPVFAPSTLLDLSGTTEGLATITYRTAGGASGSVQAASDGSFDILAIPLVEGLNNITVTATDLAGNQVTRQATITVDSVPPSIVVFQEAVVYTKEPTTQFGGLSESGAVVRVNSALAGRTGDGFSFTLALLPALNPVTITSTDAAGNTASWFGAVWYDGDLPTVYVLVTTPGRADDGTPVTRTGAVSVNGTVGDFTTRVITLTVNGDLKTFDGAGAFFLSLPVIEGLNTFVFSATDVVGNVRSATVRVLKDSAPPSAVAALREADAELVTIETIVYTRGSFVLVELSMSEDGVATVESETRAVAAGPNLFNVSLHEGTNTVSVSFRDHAGNLGTTRTLGVVRDTTAPTLVVNSPPEGAVVEDARIQVSGVSEAGAHVTVNGELVAVNTGGGFAVAVDVLAGTNTEITVIATDLLGNQNTTSVTVSRRAASVTTTPSADLSGLLLLLVGVAAGVGVGFLVRGRSRAAGAFAEGLDTGTSAESAHSRGPQEGPAAVDRGQKGPRGPQPPGAP